MEQLTSEPNYDVPDSTDWLNTPLSALMPVEQAFRCHVCKDFYNSPMLTSCNHTFCSLCIRRCLSVDGKCPLCRKTDQESRLRGNWALREAVDCFKECRASILEFARKPAPVTTAASPKRKAAEVEDSEDGAERTPKRPRRSTRSSRSRGAEATPALSQEEVYSPQRSEVADEYIPDDGLVACPICWERMKLQAVDRHISTGSCPGAPQPQSQLQAPISNGASTRSTQQNFPSTSKAKPQHPAKVLEHLPALNYSMIKDQPLRKKLAELHISTYGPRQLLEQRHKEWVTIWNANCDSAHPKTRTELLRDLETWERTMSSAARTGTLYGTQAALPQVKDKNFDGASWATSHDSSFKDLIAKARQTKKQAEQKAKEASEPELAPVVQQPNEREMAHRESGSIDNGGGNRYHNEIIGFDGAADFAIPVTNNRADQAQPSPAADSWLLK
ncbi:DNA repair protein rad18 [Coniochaeta ligniaria NRRL 30616]|uniref:Postreplication repair E3 ubiquitin-protein ligase RAD18 n=1 Tax=Coniochaeta ligniaria NRRL 30616 TaxID=1408157 RepID=A0A1J7IXZ0_9PEZI|nr:DNA repair protein rad18 [Coniochaeta ligniaria NRRL 30616]